MVITRSSQQRDAFTMIELIFAIVIISIVVLSLPMMVATTNKNMENSLAQEAIFAASAELRGILAGFWDARSLEDASQDSIARVVDIDGDCNLTTRLRPGHILQPFHRRCLDSNSSTGLDVTGSAYYSLDDAVKYVHDNPNIFNNTLKSKKGYKATYTSDATITRTNDTKKIVLSVSDNSGNLITKLITYSANVGDVTIYKKKMP